MTLRLSHGLSSLVDLYTSCSCTKMNFTKTLLLCDDDIEVSVVLLLLSLRIYDMANIHTIEENGLCVC